MITVADLRAADPRDLAPALTLTIAALVRTSRLALENETSGLTATQRADAAATALELAEELLGLLDESTDRLHREAKRGLWRHGKPDAAA